MSDELFELIREAMKFPKVEPGPLKLKPLSLHELFSIVDEAILMDIVKGKELK